MKTRLFGSLLLLLFCACDPVSHGPVRPEPPGPLDMVRSLWGDYSGRCRSDYSYCQAEGQAICCPGGNVCCSDAQGPYCCSGRADASGGRYAGQPPPYGGEPRPIEPTCSAREIQCSHDGQTVCCAGSERCCADSRGPYCCG